PHQQHAQDPTEPPRELRLLFGARKKVAADQLHCNSDRKHEYRQDKHTNKISRSRDAPMERKKHFSPAHPSGRRLLRVRWSRDRMASIDRNPERPLDAASKIVAVGRKPVMR